MLVTNATLLLASFIAVEAPQLYYFTSEDCPACKQVQPVVEELADQGVPIVHVNAPKQRQWTQQARVTALPTFIVVSQGKENGRLVGAVDFRELSHMYFSAVRHVAATKDRRSQNNNGHISQPSAQTQTQTQTQAQASAQIGPSARIGAGSPAPPMERPPAASALAQAPPPIRPAGFPNAGFSNAGGATTDNKNAEQVRGQSSRLNSPGARLSNLWENLTGRKEANDNCQVCQGECTCQTKPNDPLRVQPAQHQDAPLENNKNAPIAGRSPFSRAGTSSGSIAKNDRVDCALAATVRLKIVDELGQSFGTGTIIDIHKDEALVLTCGHIFRDSEGKGKILCDSFAPGAKAGIEGKIISYDIRRDIGLVSFRPGVPVKAVPVGSTSQRPRKSEPVFAVGCNRGDDPTVIKNEIIAVNRYHGPPNLVVGGRPIDGRSGGGLFNENGALIGVCNAADPEYDEGLYAALGNVHAELDSVGLGFIYRKNQPTLALANSSQTPKSRNRNRAPAARLQNQHSDARRLNTANQRNGAGPFESQPFESQPFESDPQAADPSKIPPLVAKIRSPADPNLQTEFVIERPSKDLLDQLKRESNRRGPHRETQLQTPNNYSEGWRSLAPQHKQ